MKHAPVIGVTGLPCAGKSYAARLLAEGEVTGVPGELVKADDIGHDVLERPDVIAKMRDRFGRSVAQAPDAAAMRRAIAEIVFRDAAELAWLESVVHPLVLEAGETVIQEAAGKKPVVIEAALLFTGGLGEVCDMILVVEANLDIRMVRAARRGWKPDELARRENRLQPLFSRRFLAPLRKKLAYVRNDEDDSLLAGRIATALADK